jgi:hypothetical protein
MFEKKEGKKIIEKNKIKEDFMKCMRDRNRIIDERNILKLKEKELEGCMKQYLLFLSSNSFI